MEANMQRIDELIQKKFRNNRSWFCDEIGISRAYLNQAEKNPKRCKKLIDALDRYCSANNLDIQQFIFFNSTVEKINHNK